MIFLCSLYDILVLEMYILIFSYNIEQVELSSCIHSLFCWYYACVVFCCVIRDDSKKYKKLNENITRRDLFPSFVVYFAFIKRFWSRAMQVKCKILLNSVELWKHKRRIVLISEKKDFFRRFVGALFIISLAAFSRSFMMIILQYKNEKCGEKGSHFFRCWIIHIHAFVIKYKELGIAWKWKNEERLHLNKEMIWMRSANGGINVVVVRAETFWLEEMQLKLILCRFGFPLGAASFQFNCQS